jgi:hypothetical protein
MKRRAFAAACGRLRLRVKSALLLDEPKDAGKGTEKVMTGGNHDHRS